MRSHPVRCRPTVSVAVIALPLVLLLCGPNPTAAAEWTIEVEQPWVSVSGHDQKVLTIREGGSASNVTMDVDDGLALPRLMARYERGRWGVGVDLWIYHAEQGTSDLTRPGGDRSFDIVGGRSYRSADPGDTLYFRVLPDNTVEVWTMDTFGTWRLLGEPGGELHGLFGIRAADFDNDYHTVTGIRGVSGTRVDASSNYDPMFGPLVGIAGEVAAERHGVRASLTLSYVRASFQLSNDIEDFEGPYGPDRITVNEERFNTFDNANIPMVEAKAGWAFQLTDHFSIGAGVDASLWQDVPVPPGVKSAGSAVQKYESSLTFLGAGVGVSYTFGSRRP